MSRKAAQLSSIGVLAVVAIGLCASGPMCVGAEEARPLPAATAPPADPVAADPLAKVRAVLASRCALCRDSHSDNGVIDLEALARDPSLVVPKRPDASRAYQDLLVRRSPQVASAGSGAEAAAPTADDAEAVRDWIERLPPRDELCHQRKALTADASEADITRWLAAVGSEAASDTRFISLAHLYNACASEQELAAYRNAVADVMAGLAHKATAPTIETVGDESAILAVRLGEAGVSAERWDALANSAPPLAGRTLAADALADAALNQSDAAATSKSTDGLMLDAAAIVRVKALAQAWRRDIDLTRAAAELGIDSAALTDKLLAVEGDAEPAARRLVQGLISRPAWTALRESLEGQPARPRDAIASKPPARRERIDIGLWTDKPTYKAGDLLTVAVSVDLACHLTLVSIDGDGKAIILYPNDGEPDNLIAPGVTVRVPGRQAGYQFRLDRAGEETLVAHCRRTTPRMDGVTVDYEKQRFTILGNWRAFLKTAAAREAEIKQHQSPPKRSRRKNRDRDTDEPQPAIDPDGPEVEGRAAVTLTIAP